jgi:hypothetical protein
MGVTASDIMLLNRRRNDRVSGAILCDCYSGLRYMSIRSRSSATFRRGLDDFDSVVMYHYRSRLAQSPS